jgi:hypothetical protein
LSKPDPRLESYLRSHLSRQALAREEELVGLALVLHEPPLLRLSYRRPMPRFVKSGYSRKRRFFSVIRSAAKTLEEKT